MIRLRPFFTYYGGKWRLAPKYPAPRHDLIIEPFAGSAGYSLLYPDREVWLNDLNPQIYGIWKYLIAASRDEILALPDEPDDSIPQEAQWLIRMWWAKGRAELPNHRSPWNTSGKYSHHANFWGPLIRERLASQVDRINHWRITNLDYRELPETAATWFIDPPYEKTGTRYPTCAVDFETLWNWSTTRPGFSIVCEQEGATWLERSSPLGEVCTTYGVSKRRVSKEIYATAGV